MTIFGNFFEKNENFWQFFDSQTAIFRRVSLAISYHFIVFQVLGNDYWEQNICGEGVDQDSSQVDNYLACPHCQLIVLEKNLPAHSNSCLADRADDSNESRNSKISPFINLVSDDDDYEMEDPVVKIELSNAELSKCQSFGGEDYSMPLAEEKLDLDSLSTINHNTCNSYIKRKSQKRKRWSEEEEAVIFDEFKTHLVDRRNPRNSEIIAAQEKHDVLKQRSVPIIKTKINNIILGKNKNFSKEN